jgi:hypothetical protein
MYPEPITAICIVIGVIARFRWLGRVLAWVAALLRGGRRSKSRFPLLQLILVRRHHHHH